MPYNEENTTPIFQEDQNWSDVEYSRPYETVRPECHFDLKQFDYFVPAKQSSSNSQIESKFTLVGITYDYFEDYETWNHVEGVPPYPTTLGPGNHIPAPSVFTDGYKSYGFNYSTKVGVGNSKYTWYSHTDLDLDMFKKIKNEIRKPIIEKVKEAKRIQDIYNHCKIVKYLTDQATEAGEEPPIFPPIYEYNEEGKKVEIDCEDYSCSRLQEAINEIPLECQQITEVLGATYAGSDLSNYWWEGWLPEGYLSSVDYIDIDPMIHGGGTTYNAPALQAKNKDIRPPYQNVIGSYQCPTIETGENENNLIVAPVGSAPFYGALGGFTADPCGCVNDSDESFNLPSYISECEFPKMGGAYPEYLEYVASKDARYWNTPFKSILLRKAQMKLIFSSEIEIDVPGDFAVSIGKIIETRLPAPLSSTLEDGSQTQKINPLNGRWLVVQIKHIIESGGHVMRLKCVRDSNHVDHVRDGTVIPEYT